MLTNTLLTFLNSFLEIFHILLVLFVAFGWIIPKWRLAHLSSSLLIGVSWFILGIFKGVGYCLITDWQWQILSEMGVTQLPKTYFQYFFQRILGITIEITTAKVIIYMGWFLTLVLSTYLLIRERLPSYKATND